MRELLRSLLASWQASCDAATTSQFAGAEESKLRSELASAWTSQALNMLQVASGHPAGLESSTCAKGMGKNGQSTCAASCGFVSGRWCWLSEWRLSCSAFTRGACGALGDKRQPRRHCGRWGPQSSTTLAASASKRRRTRPRRSKANRRIPPGSFAGSGSTSFTTSLKFVTSLRVSWQPKKSIASGWRLASCGN
jgi:hypothetical protein